VLDARIASLMHGAFRSSPEGLEAMIHMMKTRQGGTHPPPQQAALGGGAQQGQASFGKAFAAPPNEYGAVGGGGGCGGGNSISSMNSMWVQAQGRAQGSSRGGMQALNSMSGDRLGGNPF